MAEGLETKVKVQKIPTKEKVLNNFLKICKKEKREPTYEDINMLFGLYEIFYEDIIFSKVHKVGGILYNN